MDIKKEIKRSNKDGRTVIGSKETLKNIEDIEKVILASNAPQDIVKKIGDKTGEEAEVVRFEGSNKELGSVCGKPFNVSTVGIKRKERLV